MLRGAQTSCRFDFKTVNLRSARCNGLIAGVCRSELEPGAQALGLRRGCASVAFVIALDTLRSDECIGLVN